MQATFTMANISPQYKSFNRGVWQQLEMYCKSKMMNGLYDEVWVISGPVFAPVQVNGELIHVNKTIGM